MFSILYQSTFPVTSSHFFLRQSRSNEQWKSGTTATNHELHVTCLRSHISGEVGKPGESGVVVLCLLWLWLCSEKKCSGEVLKLLRTLNSLANFNCSCRWICTLMYRFWLGGSTSDQSEAFANDRLGVLSWGAISHQQVHLRVRCWDLLYVA